MLRYLWGSSKTSFVGLYRKLRSLADGSIEPGESTAFVALIMSSSFGNPSDLEGLKSGASCKSIWSSFDSSLLSSWF